MAAITEACHASEASGYCPGTGCGTSNTTIKYPFRLLGDATNNVCYSNFTELLFVCLNETLYLNITTNPLFSYKVLDINYINQTLDILPVSNSWCLPFDPSGFGTLNVTNISGTSRSVLECNTTISPNCTSIKSTPSSSTCSSGFNYSCPFQPGKYGNESCYLDQSNNATIHLGWQGSSSSMFQNLIYNIICSVCSFRFGL